MSDHGMDSSCTVRSWGGQLTYCQIVGWPVHVLSDYDIDSYDTVHVLADHGMDSSRNVRL